jgi:2-methylisocitrate lyase-like PEP mutase family enzyme
MRSQAIAMQAIAMQAIAMKALLDHPGRHVMPGCGDGLGARLIAEAGFRTGFVSGSGVMAEYPAGDARWPDPR